MNRSINRAEQLWHNWEEKQKQLQGLPGLGEESSVAIKRQKYEFLRQGLYRLSVNPTEKEALFVHVIRSVTDKLQRQLYPNPVVRLLHRLKELVYDKPIHLRQFQRQREENLDMLKGQLKTAGFASFNGKLENHLDYETNKVPIHLTRQLNGETRLDITLNMERDQVGRYHFSRYEATLLKDGEAARSYAFQTDSRIDAMEAANLLDGRAVRKSFEMADGSLDTKWVQLDFVKRDADGKVKLQEFHEGYGYNLKSELQALAQSGVTGLVKDKIIQSLEAGNVATFHVRDKGPYYLHANPAEKMVSLFDKDKKPLEMAGLLKQIRQPKPNQAQTIRLVKTPEKEQGQSLGIG